MSGRKCLERSLPTGLSIPIRGGTGRDGGDDGAAGSSGEVLGVVVGVLGVATVLVGVAEGRVMEGLERMH